MKIELTYEELHSVIKEAIRLEAQYLRMWINKTVTGEPEQLAKLKELKKKIPQYSWTEALKGLEKKKD